MTRVVVVGHRVSSSNERAGYMVLFAQAVGAEQNRTRWGQKVVEDRVVVESKHARLAVTQLLSKIILLLKTGLKAFAATGRMRAAW
jgi:hypothetical protein